MDPNQVLVAVTGFVSSLVGAGIAFWAQAWHWRRVRKAQAVDEESRAIHRLLVKALSIDLRAHQLALAARSRGSLDGTMFALFGSEGLINVDATIRALHVDAEELESAATQLWLSSDAETVELARAVSVASGDVIAAHATRRRRGILGWILDVIRGPQLGDPDRIDAARGVLAEKREQLVKHARKRVEVPELVRSNGRPLEVVPGVPQ